MVSWLEVAGVTLAFVGVWLQLLGDTIRVARGERP